jgi:hypothetical protein
MPLLPLLIAFALAVVVAVLATGVVAFAKGGAWYERNATRLLHLRVAAQAVAVLLLALLAWLAHS